MEPQGRSFSIKKILFPFSSWPKDGLKGSFRPDIEAGLISAILTLPQAIALAMLAGMPPEYGIYTSIVPVAIASLWGSSWHTLSGPNTAICVLITYAVAPLAGSGSQEYIGYVLVLSLMVGVIQLSIAALKLGGILDFISHTVINAVILAVAFIIMVSAGSGLLGISSASEYDFISRLQHLGKNLTNLNVYALSIGVITIASGLIAKKYLRRYALIIAMLAGVLATYIMGQTLPASETAVRHIQPLAISLLPFSIPSFGEDAAQTISLLSYSALSIALIGLMQTIVISRSIAEKSHQIINTRQEITGQGLANIAASFFSGFAGSGSFNRSAVNFAAGARTPLAAIYASILLAFIVYWGEGFINYLSLPVISGTLILVALGLINFDIIKKLRLSRQEIFIFFTTLIVSLSIGLNNGILAGVLSSLVIYLWNASRPNLLIDEYIARGGQPITTIHIDGNLFFGSVHFIERALNDLIDHAKEQIFLLRTDHITYIDIAGACMLANEATRQTARGNSFYLFITRDNIYETFKKTGLLDTIGDMNIIRKGRHHPMQDLLNPSLVKGKAGASGKKTEEFKMEDLIKRLRSTRLIGPLSTEQLSQLLNDCEIKTAAENDILLQEDEQLDSHLILIEGEIEVQRTWRDSNGYGRSYTKILHPKAVKGGFAFQSAATSNLRMRVLKPSRYILINADKIDDMLGWSEQFENDIIDDPELEKRMRLARNVSIFQQLPTDNIKKAFQKMRPVDFKAGDVVISQAEKGDKFYLIETGVAEVYRTEPFTEDTECVAKLFSGDSFGEEALLQDSLRNATVTMTTPGTLLVLSKADFKKLIHSSIVEEITASDANDKLTSGEVKLLDCRYDMEHEESRIPGSQLIPLDRLRWDVHLVNPEGSYVVYCRSGRRSKAAAYLLRERNIKAVSLTGGILDWPYEIDNDPLTVELPEKPLDS